MNDEMLAQVQRGSRFQVLNGSDRGFSWRRNSELEKKHRNGASVSSFLIHNS